MFRWTDYEMVPKPQSTYANFSARRANTSLFARLHTEAAAVAGCTTSKT
jgi:hypothetical protein